MPLRHGEPVVLHRFGPWWARTAGALDPLRHHPVARRAARRRLGAAAVAVAVAAITSHLAADGRRLRDGWGRTVPVAITTREVAAGEVLDGAVRLERRPAAVVTEGAPPTLPPVGRRAAHDLPARRELVAGDTAPAGRGPLAAALPVGTAGVTLRLDGPAPEVAPGDRVDVVGEAPGVLTPDMITPVPAGPDPGPRLARRAVVLEVGDGTVTLAVAEADAARTAAAAASGGTTLVVRR